MLRTWPNRLMCVHSMSCESKPIARSVLSDHSAIGITLGMSCGRLSEILRRVIPRAEMRQNLALMPQAISEHLEVGRFDGRLADYSEITATTLITRGKGRDTDRQAVALARLAGTIPCSETATFPTLDHFAPEKKPGEIADVVLRFFAAHARPGVQTGG
jgi:pimeloyl-ACP methyl ester carboxylesterase